jgi:hypothetical protein
LCLWFRHETFVRKVGQDIRIARSFICHLNDTLLTVLTARENFEGAPEVNESWIASEEKYEGKTGLELDIDGE